jgi:hypothetical protein
MRILLFCDRPALYERFGTSAERIEGLLHRVAEGTETRDLVTCVHVTSRGCGWGGQALAERWLTPAFLARARWPRPRRNRAFAIPDDLPSRFKLIRLHCGGQVEPYPACHTSRYRFTWRFPAFEDHLGHLFAHELHHFRRHHLGLHPREGEVAAERWAHARMRALGSGTTLQRRPRQRRRWARQALPRRVLEAHARLADVRPGTPLRCTEPSGRIGGIVRVERPPRRGAWRMAVKDIQGRDWLVPLGYLDKVN